MTDAGTRRYAANLDRVRRRRGPAGDLTFLRFTGAHDYEPARVVQAGWFAEVKKRRDQSAGDGKPVYLAVEVAVLPGTDLGDVLREEWRIAVAGLVYTIDKDRLTPPVTSPYRWLIEAYRSTDPDDTYTAPAP